MKVIEEIVYKEIKSYNSFSDVDKLVEDNRRSDNYFNYFFELFEDDNVVVFANLAGFKYSPEKDSYDKEWGRTFQIETALYVKNHPDYKNKVYYLIDNNGFDSLSKLNGLPVWTKEEFIEEEISNIVDAPVGFPFGNGDYFWGDYV